MTAGRKKAQDAGAARRKLDRLTLRLIDNVAKAVERERSVARLDAVLQHTRKAP